MISTWIYRTKQYLLDFIQNQPGSKKYTKNVFWLLSEKAVKFLAELLVGFYIARSLGVVNFGTLNYAISLTILFQGTATLGLSEILTRELLHFRNQRGKILGTSLFLRLLAAIIFILVINLIAWSETHEVRFVLFIISLSLFFRSFEILTFYFQSKVNSQKVAEVQILCTLLVSLIKVYLVHQGYGIVSFAWVYSFEWFIISIGLVIAYFKHASEDKWFIEKTWAKKLIGNSWTLMLSAAAVNIYMRIDQVMIREMISDKENGYFSAALRLTEFWYVIPMILCSTLFPAILNARRIDRKLYEKRMLALNAFLFWVSITIAITISSISSDLVVLLYNEDYSPSSSILAIQIWSLSFSFFGVSGSYWLMAENLQHFSLIRTLLGLAVNLLLNFVLIPDYGAVGAAIATLVTQAFAASFSLLLLRKTKSLWNIQLKSIIYPFQWLLKDKLISLK